MPIDHEPQKSGKTFSSSKNTIFTQTADAPFCPKQGQIKKNKTKTRRLTEERYMNVPCKWQTLSPFEDTNRTMSHFMSPNILFPSFKLIIALEETIILSTIPNLRGKCKIKH